MTPLVESVAGTEDSTEIPPVSLEKEHLPCCQIVEEPAYPHDMAEILIGQILIKHGQGIAEIEEGLHGITLRQRSSTNMIDGALGIADNMPASPHQPPTKIDLLTMGKETAVEATRHPIILRPDHQAGSRRPCHLSRIVILAIVTLHAVKDTATTEGIAITVDISAGSTRILKGILIFSERSFG